MLRNGFKDLSISHTCVACGTAEEGLWLYEIETDTDLSRDSIVKGLQMWGVALEDANSAKALAEKLVDRAVTIKDGRIIIPEDPHLIGESKNTTDA